MAANTARTQPREARPSRNTYIGLLLEGSARVEPTTTNDDDSSSAYPGLLGPQRRLLLLQLQASLEDADVQRRPPVRSSP